MKFLNTLNLFAVIVFATTALSAFAVEYTLPEDGWYQLKGANTSETLCNSSFSRCDVPPGIYQLINHSVPTTDTRHTTFVNIANDKNPPLNLHYGIESTVVNTDCLYGFPGRPKANDDQPCVAQCPDSYSLTGGSCRAWRNDRYIKFGPDGQFALNTTVRISTLNKPEPDSYSCELDMEADYLPDMGFFVANNFTNTQVKATAICATIVSQ